MKLKITPQTNLNTICVFLSYLNIKYSIDGKFIDFELKDVEKLKPYISPDVVIKEQTHMPANSVWFNCNEETKLVISIKN